MIFNMVGGGGGGTKSTIIVSIETGSTVGIYDSTYTTLIKRANEKSTGEYWLTGLDNGTYYVKATKGSDTATASYTITEYGVYRITMTYSTIPEFSYTGTYEIVNDSDTPITTSSDNWKIRFLTSGTLNFSRLNGAENGIDVFLVGGGGGGGSKGSYANANSGGGGGGGGYVATQAQVSIAEGTPYSIEIGDGGSAGNAGGASSAFGYSANGGSGTTGYNGANGGSGGGAGGWSWDHVPGIGGSDGGNGTKSDQHSAGTGSGASTREFYPIDSNASATLYSDGGSGGGGYGASKTGTTANPAGHGGGGKNQPNGTANTGGGGAGQGYDTGNETAGIGGSGIVIIRNARSVA